MKRLLWLCLLPLTALAGAREDYAQQWPLTLHDPVTGAYRVTLDSSVYRSAQSSTLRDVDVVNGDGATVPAAIFAAGQPLAQMRRMVELPWFPLPRDAATAQDISVISERNADGSVQRVETRMAGVSAGQATLAANAWLIDASRVRSGVVALELDWSPSSSAMDAAYRVEGSDDLKSWRVLQQHVQLLDLSRDGQRFQQRRIALDGSAKYLRLLPAGDGAALAITSVRAQLGAPPATLAWTWQTLDGKSATESGVDWTTFDLDGRFPIERADVMLDGNNAGEWTLQSRDDPDASWKTRAGPWVAYRVGSDTAADRSAPQSLNEVIRDRYWRLSSRTPVAGAPKLRLGYRPEVVVFVAQGQPPFSIVAGSVRATRNDAPIAQIIDSLRTQRGEDWQPAPSILGNAQPLAGQAALETPFLQRNWKSWLLWALLLGGAALVVGFALSLMRGRPKS